MKYLRQSRNSNEMAEVLLPRMAAEEFIKMGWISCRVQGKQSSDRCYKYLETGHKSAKCKGPDLSNVCLKCGQEGNKIREYGNADFCRKCNTEGHRTGRNICPEVNREKRDETTMRKGKRKTALSNE